uniref:Uncharacterized protein n=1 Tax=Oryza sativa subsp. japonica TaxID=39947 RepID=Q6K3T1_ORYSJ|nr:hypothetical protein [Oryza sativa Japonica Group]BAD27743.1 hypothetical protein [Oryza sativa Japonica Group]
MQLRQMAVDAATAAVPTDRSTSCCMRSRKPRGERIEFGTEQEQQHAAALQGGASSIFTLHDQSISNV